MNASQASGELILLVKIDIDMLVTALKTLRSAVSAYILYNPAIMFKKV